MYLYTRPYLLRLGGIMPEKCIALNDITYKDKWYKINSEILVDDKDVNNLVWIGAIRMLSERPKTRSKVITIKDFIAQSKEQLDEVAKEIAKEEEMPKIEEEATLENFKKNKKKRNYVRR